MDGWTHIVPRSGVSGIRSSLLQFGRCAATLLLALSLCAIPGSGHFLPWRMYRLGDGDLVVYDGSSPLACSNGLALPESRPILPSTWSVAHEAFADVTGDGDPEWVLVVWRAWEDWPIQQWVSAPSPIAGYHDQDGNSCHLVLLDPVTGREQWAGSALPVPLLSLAVGDVNGDGINEIVTLEGSYARGQAGPGSHVVVWRWSDFGFSMVQRSAAGIFGQVCLTSQGNSSILSMLVQ